MRAVWYRNDDVDEPPFGQRSAREHVRSAAGNVGPQVIGFLDGDEFEIPAEHLPRVALRLGAQLGGRDPTSTPAGAACRSPPLTQPRTARGSTRRCG